MANILWDLVDLGELTRYVRAFDNEVIQNQLVLERFLPNTPVEGIEFKIKQGGFEDVDAAQFRAWDTQPGMGKRQGFSRMRGELPPVSRQIPLSEEENLRLRQLQSLGTSGGEDALIDAIFNDAERMARAVQVRIELARAQALYTGKVTINENGLAIEADFGVPGGNFLTPGTVWSNAAATILTDLLTYQQTYVDLNGESFGQIVMSTQAFNYMLTNTELKNAAAFAGTTPSRLTPTVVNEIFGTYGLPIPQIYDAKFRVNGTSSRAIPADRVLLLPPAGTPLGETLYGTTLEAIELANRGLITRQDVPGVTTLVLRNESPVQTFTVSTAIALPVIGNPKAMMVVDAF